MGLISSGWIWKDQLIQWSSFQLINPTPRRYEQQLPHTMPTALRPDLELTLRLRPADEPDTFFNAEPMFTNPFTIAVYGGFYAAQALWAAFQTVPSNVVPRSLHCYFLNRVIVGPPVKYVVSRLRDGGLFYTRDIRAYQSGQLVFCELVQFVVEERFEDTDTGLKPYPSHVKFEDFFDQHTSFKKGCVGRGLIPSMFVPLFQPELDRFDKGPMEVRVLPDHWGKPPDLYTDDNYKFTDFFLRNRTPVRDPRFHYVALTYASDLYTLTLAAQQNEKKTFFDIVMAASLEHTLYFHKRPCANKWRLHHIEPLQSGNTRSLVKGEFFDKDSGELIATAVQEGIVAFAGLAEKSKL